MSFGLGLGLTLGGTSGGSKFPASGPSLDLVFAGAATSGSAAANSSLDLNFTGESYTVGDPYSVWTGSRMQTRGFQDVVTFSRATGNATYYNSSGYLTLAGVLNYLIYSNQPENANWQKLESFVQSNLFTYSNQPDNAGVWLKSNSYVQSNLLTYSELFENAAWTKFNSFIQTNLLLQSNDLTSYSITPATGLTSTLNATSAPDGTVSARRIVNTSTTEQHRLFQSVTLSNSTAYTYSIYLKNDTAGWCQLSFFLGSTLTAFGNFNLASGTVGTTGSATAAIQAVGSGWYRCSITATTEATGSPGNVQVYVLESDPGVANPTTTGTVKGIFVYGAQLVQGSVPGDYQATTTTTAAVSYANWDGTLTARKLAETAATGIHVGYQTLSRSAGVSTYTGSIYFKAAEPSRWLRLVVSDSGTTSYSAVFFDPATGTIASSVVNVGFTGGIASITSVGSGWYRAVLTTTTDAATSGISLQVYLANSISVFTYAGNGSSGIYISDAQLVLGAVPAQYYATTAAILPILYSDYTGATRARKVCENAVAGLAHGVRQNFNTTTAQIYTVSFYAKAGERNFAAAWSFGGLASPAGRVFNLTNGTTQAAGGFVSSTYGMVDAGNGWWRCWYTFTVSTGTATTTHIGPHDGGANDAYNGDGISGVYVADFQLVQGSVFGNYRETTTAALHILYPDWTGALLARKVCQNTAVTLPHGLRQVVSSLAGSSVYTLSFYAKAGESTKVNAWQFATSSFPSTSSATFDLVAGTATGDGSPTIQLVGNGWYRCAKTLTTVVAPTAGTIHIGPTDAAGNQMYTGDGTSGAYFTDIQFELGAVPGLYYDTNAYVYNAPRFDYNPATLLPSGFLVEEQRTNLETYSNDFSNAIWFAASGAKIVAASTFVSPDGNINAWTLTDSSAINFDGIHQPVTVAADTATYTGSVYIRKTTGGTSPTFGINMIVSGGTTVNNNVRFNTDLGTVLAGTATVTDVGSWWRVACPITNNGTVGNTALAIQLFAATNTYNQSASVVSATGSATIYGAQLEIGAFASSYIPTVASQLTRAVDVSNISTITPWFNRLAGTIFAEGIVRPNVGLGVVAAFNNGVNYGTGSGFLLRVDNTTAQAGGNGSSANISGVTAGAVFRAAGGYQNINQFVDLNGVTPVSNAVCDYTGVGTTALTIGALSPSGSGTQQLNGWIRRIAYYPRRLTDTELQTMTAL